MRMVIGGLLFAWCFVFGYHGNEHINLINKKTAAQLRINKEMQQFKRSFESLVPVQKEWAERFDTYDPTVDLFTIYQGLNIKGTGLTGRSDNFKVDTAESINIDNKPIGLVSQCMSNNGIDFQVDHVSLDALIGDLEKVLNRKDISIDAIHIGTKNGRATARFRNFCLMERISQS